MEKPMVEKEEAPEVETQAEEKMDVSDLSPKDAMEILEQADAIRADAPLMAAIRKMKGQAKKPKDLAEFKAMHNKIEPA